MSVQEASTEFFKQFCHNTAIVAVGTDELDVIIVYHDCEDNIPGLPKAFMGYEVRQSYMGTKRSL